MTNIIVVDPTTQQEIGRVMSSTSQEVHQKVSKAKEAQKEWGSLPIAQRIETLRDVYTKFHDRIDEIGEMVTKSIGMPVSLRKELDLESGLTYFEWYLDHAEEVLKPEISYQDDSSINIVYYEPTGVAAVLSPWNFPFCQFVWQLIPNLVVGNTVVFKHASNCALVGKLIEEIMHSSKLPDGVFEEVYGSGEVGELLVHENVDLISFTGSTEVGKKLYRIGSEKVTRVLLELGGSAPGIVFADADLDQVAEAVFFNRFVNSGQICDGLKRLIVEKSIAHKVEAILVKMLQTKKLGDPQNSETFIGPLVSEKQANLIQAQVADAITKGVKILIGGKKPEGFSAAFFEPTILTRVSKNMEVWQSEVFGPALPIMTFETEEEAIQLANETKYGLGGYIFTKDKTRAQRVAEALKTGMVSVNGVLYLHPASPFGGYKQSGIGREHGKYGLHELCQIKVVATEK